MPAHRLLCPPITIMYLFTFLVIFLPLFHAIHGSFGAHQQINLSGLFGFSSSYGKKESEILRRDVLLQLFWRHNPDTIARYTALRFSSIFSGGFPSSAVRLFPIQLHIPWCGSIKLLQLNEQFNIVTCDTLLLSSARGALNRHVARPSPLNFDSPSDALVNTMLSAFIVRLTFSTRYSWQLARAGSTNLRISSGGS